MNENTLEFSLRYNSSIDPMLPSDCLIEVMETMPILGGTMIRKTLFDIIINDCMYPDTSSVLTESAIFFRLKVKMEIFRKTKEMCISRSILASSCGFK